MKKLVQCFPPPVLKPAVVPVLIPVSGCSCSSGGPLVAMAQDFYAAFALGMDDKHISMVDPDGAALASIQGLNQKVDLENSRLREGLKQKGTEIIELKQRLGALERIVLSHKLN